MDVFNLANDIDVFCVQASSFPMGVQAAHEKLHKWAPFGTVRKYFGISWPDKDGNIQYKAAAEELKPGELSGHGFEPFTIKKGNFLCIDVHNYMKDIPAIGNAFNQLIKDDRIDPQGYCLEWYVSNELCKCMVPMRP